MKKGCSSLERLRSISRITFRPFLRASFNRDEKSSKVPTEGSGFIKSTTSTAERAMGSAVVESFKGAVGRKEERETAATFRDLMYFRLDFNPIRSPFPSSLES